MHGGARLLVVLVYNTTLGRTRLIPTRPSVGHQSNSRDGKVSSKASRLGTLELIAFLMAVEPFEAEVDWPSHDKDGGGYRVPSIAFQVFRRYHVRVGQVSLGVNPKLRSCCAVDERQDKTVGRRGGTMGHFWGKNLEVKCLGLEKCCLSHACRATSKHMPTASSRPPPKPPRTPIHVAFHSMSPSPTAAGLPQWPVKRPLSPRCTRHAR